MVGWYPKIVSLESRNYVHVEVKDLLSRFSICQEKANSFTSQPRLADGIRYTHGDLEKMGSYLFKITMRVADAVRKSGLRCEGIGLFLADREPRQEILHLHMHVIPRFQETIFGYQPTMAPHPRGRNLTKQQTKYAGHTNGYENPRNMSRRSNVEKDRNCLTPFRLRF